MSKIFKYPAPGKLVTVNGHEMHVFIEGKGEDVLVFMSGNGTACPTLDFKPLWALLTNKYKIAVIERFGYGWSDATSNPRDIDAWKEEQAYERTARLRPDLLK